MLFDFSNGIRFEHLNGRFVPDDQIGVKKQGDNGSNDTVRKDQYKYALGNENDQSMPMSTKSIQTFQNHLVVLYGLVWDHLGTLRMFHSMEM